MLEQPLQMARIMTRRIGTKVGLHAVVTAQRVADVGGTRIARRLTAVNEAVQSPAGAGTAEHRSLGELSAAVRDAWAGPAHARKDVLILSGSGDDIASMPHIKWELRRLGATPRNYQAKDVTYVDGQMYHKGKAVPTPEVVIARAFQAQSPGLAVLDGLQAAGVDVVQDSAAFRFGRSKVTQAGVYRDLGIPHPPTIPLRHSEDMLPAVKTLGLPTVIKVDDTSGGAGVSLVRDMDAAIAKARELLPVRIEPNADRSFGLKPIPNLNWAPTEANFLSQPVPGMAMATSAQVEMAKDVLAQKFRAGAAGSDWRVDAVRGTDGKPHVTSILSRTAPVKGEFRANAPGVGNVPHYVPLDEVPNHVITDTERLMDHVGADVLGVDWMHDAALEAEQAAAGAKDASGWETIEANSTPAMAELDSYQPRERHMIPRLAERAVFGTPSTRDAQAGVNIHGATTTTGVSA